MIPPLRSFDDVDGKERGQKKTDDLRAMTTLGPHTLEYFPFKQKHFQKNVHCNIVKHTTKHLIGAIENINTIDDYRPKIVRIIVFFIKITHRTGETLQSKHCF